MKEVLLDNMEKIESSYILDKLKLKEKNYFIISAHREENVDNPKHLSQILEVLNTLASEYDMPVIVSTHPRTRNRLESLKSVMIDDRIQFLKPFGFFDYINLQMNALCTVSDSGTISEESSILSFPAISLRQSMERPEAQDAGTIILTGFDVDVVLGSIRTVIDEHKLGGYERIAEDYTITNTSFSNKWWGIANMSTDDKN